MAKVKVSLEKAKELLKNDKVFIANSNQFNVIDVGKYNSGWTLVIPREWELDEDDEPVVPDIMEYRECKALTDGMNVDFNANENACFVRFGQYRKSSTGKPVFAVSEPKDAKYVIVKACWGGAFSHRGGQKEDAIKEIGKTEFVRRSSNGGGLGNDFYIFPIDYIFGEEKRDVSPIIDSAQQSLEEERKEKQIRIGKIKEERRKSLEQKDKISSEIRGIMEKFKKEYGKDLDIKFGEIEVSIGYRYYNYSEEALEKAKELYDMCARHVTRDTEKSKIKNDFSKELELYKETLDRIEAEVDISDKCVQIRFVSREIPRNPDTPSYSNKKAGYDYKTYEYDDQIMVNFNRDLLEAIDNYTARKNAEISQKNEVLRKQQQMEAERDAKEKGYPTNYEFHNRLYGVTRLSHAYVISSDGSIKDPDNNLLDNPNHRRNYSSDRECINDADGTQVYNQILPGEIIVSYSKEFTRRPYVVNIEWLDREPTEDQLLTIKQVFKKLSTSNFIVIDKDDAVGDYSNEDTHLQIKNFEEWAKRKAEAILPECRKTIEDQKTVSGLRQLANAIDSEVENQDF